MTSAAPAQTETSFLTRTISYGAAAPLFVAFMCASVALSIWQDFVVVDAYRTPAVALAGLAGSIVSFRMLHVGVDRAIVAAIAGVLAYMAVQFPASANHHWLFLWFVLPLAIRPDLLRTEAYSRYIAVTFGIAMIAAGVQKLLSGNYIDGSFLAYLAAMGGSSERMVNLVCLGGIGDRNLTPCGAMVALSWAVMAWQFIVGALLILHKRSLFVLLLEAGFVLGVGFLADEMSFQCLSLCALMIATRTRMPVWFPCAILALKVVAIVSVSRLFLIFGIPT